MNLHAEIDLNARFGLRIQPVEAILGLPELCRNKSSPVVPGHALTSTGASSEPFKNNYLKMPNCLREAGAGGSHPLTPTSQSLK
jgi:hypothetical protein